MKVVVLDGNKIKTGKDLHKTFAETLALPDWYGNNLDALYDVLTTLPGEIGIIAVNTAELKEALGRRWQSFLRLMADVQKARQDVYVCLSPFEKQ